MGIRPISKLLGFSNNTVRKIINESAQPIKYLDLETSEIVESMVRISVVKQNYFYVYHKKLYDELLWKLDGKRSTTIMKKSLNVRLAKILELSERTTSRWLKEPHHYISVNWLEQNESWLDGVYDARILEVMSKMYYLTAKGFARGHLLYYMDYYEAKGGFVYYINRSAISFANSSLTEKEYLRKIRVEHKDDFMEFFTARIGVKLGRWIREQVGLGVDYHDIIHSMHLNELYADLEEEPPIEIPQAIYYEAEGISLVGEGIKGAVLEQLKDGEIILYEESV
jgi:hypothetical protein